MKGFLINNKNKFLDPPEIEMEQVWSNHGTEVEVDCIVNSDPKPQVSCSQTTKIG